MFSIILPSIFESFKTNLVFAAKRVAAMFRTKDERTAPFSKANEGYKRKPFEQAKPHSLRWR